MPAPPRTSEPGCVPSWCPPVPWSPSTGPPRAVCMGTCLVAPSLGDTVALLGLHSGWPEALRGWRRWRGGQEKLNLSHNTKVCIVHRPARGAFGYFGGWSSKTCPHPHIHLLPSLLHCCLFQPGKQPHQCNPPAGMEDTGEPATATWVMGQAMQGGFLTHTGPTWVSTHLVPVAVFSTRP